MAWAGWQSAGSGRSVRGLVGAQDVGQHEGVPGVGFLARHRVPVPIGLSHLEIVGSLARLHLKPMKSVREAAEADPLIAIAGGGGVNLFNSMGNAWTADYLKITGELDVDCVATSLPRPGLKLSTNG